MSSLFSSPHAAVLSRASVSANAISDEMFLDELRRASRSNPWDKDFRYVSAFLPAHATDEGLLATLFTQTSRRCDTANVGSLMAREELAWPDLDAESVASLAHFLARRHFRERGAAPRVGGIRQPISTVLS